MFVRLSRALTRPLGHPREVWSCSCYTTHCPLSVREQFVRRTPAAAITIPLSAARSKNSTMRKVAILLLAAQAWAAEVCVSKKGELLTTDYVVQPIDAPDKSQRCYALAQPSMQELLRDEAFWTRDHLEAWARSRPWYVYLLTAWVLSAVTTLLK